MPLFSNTAPKKKAEDEDISYADEEEQKSLLASTQAEFQQYKLENEMKLKKLEEALEKLEDKNETDEEAYKTVVLQTQIIERDSTIN